MRASGILLPVSSLPSKYGIGCFSKSAFLIIFSTEFQECPRHSCCEIHVMQCMTYSYLHLCNSTPCELSINSYIFYRNTENNVVY